jgi:nucleotide-binding universal stress UspA family protein
VHELAAGGKLVIVYACWSQHTPPSPLSTADERRDEGRAVLDELLLGGNDALLDVELETQVSDQDPAAALVEAARRHGASAIVLGARHHSRLHGALGTVTTELLKTSPVPVITVPLSATRASRQALAPLTRS